MLCWKVNLCALWSVFNIDSIYLSTQIFLPEQIIVVFYFVICPCQLSGYYIFNVLWRAIGKQFKGWIETKSPIRICKLANNCSRRTFSLDLVKFTNFTDSYLFYLLNLTVAAPPPPHSRLVQNFGVRDLFEYNFVQCCKISKDFSNFGRRERSFFSLCTRKWRKKPQILFFLNLKVVFIKNLLNNEFIDTLLCTNPPGLLSSSVKARHQKTVKY